MRTRFEFPDPIIDMRNGYAVNIDLGEQAPAEFWHAEPGSTFRAQIYERRAELGIQCRGPHCRRHAERTHVGEIRPAIPAPGWPPSSR